jgi:DtxR family Mn-dependent transcriptional regulator
MPKYKDSSTPSEAVQDFLKKVYTLQQDQDRVSTNALADALNITAPSVTDMAQRLVKEGTIDYMKYKGVRLTEKGQSVALNMLRRHRLIELYLVQDLGYELHEVHDEAESLEHTVSERFIEAIAHKLGHPEYDPHGDPIPNVQGVMPKRDLQSLASLPVDKPARICRFIMENPDMLQFTQERGMVMGTEVTVLTRDPFDGPLTLQMDQNNETIIGHAIAVSILVELLDPL